MKTGIVFCILMLSYSLSFGQTSALNLQLLPFKLSLQEPHFFIPSITSSVVVLKSSSSTSSEYVSIFKSPIHYTAFFCKMELKTVNRLGIWIKVHAGDYDAYTSGCENFRQ